METFQKRLKKFRWSLEYTMKEFARELGVNEFTYAGFESGRRKPSIQLLKRLVIVYNINLNEWILGI